MLSIWLFILSGILEHKPKRIKLGLSGYSEATYRIKYIIQGKVSCFIPSMKKGIDKQITPYDW